MRFWMPRPEGGKRGRPRDHPGPSEEAEQPPAESTSSTAIVQSIQRTSQRNQQEIDETVQVKEKQWTQTIPSNASMVDLDEVIALELVPTNEINGVKCAKLVMEDIEDEVAYWQNAVICCVLGVTPPF